MKKLFCLLAFIFLAWLNVDAQCSESGKMKFPVEIKTKMDNLNIKLILIKEIKASYLISSLNEIDDTERECSQIRDLLIEFRAQAKVIFKDKIIDKKGVIVFNGLEDKDVKDLLEITQKKINSLATTTKVVKSRNEPVGGDGQKTDGLWSTIWKIFALILFLFILLIYVLAHFLPEMLNKLLFIKKEQQANVSNNSSYMAQELSKKNTELEDLRSEYNKLKELLNTPKEQKNYSYNDSINKVQELSRKNSGLYEEIRDLKVQNRQKDQEIESLNNKTKFRESDVNSLLFPPEDNKKHVDNKETEQVEQYDLSKSFFLSIPSFFEGKVVFNNKRDMNYNPLNSYYKFSIISNTWDSEAKFEVADLNENGINNAIQYYDIYLDPACEYDFLNRNTKRIITKKPGKAKKVDDKWVVISKAFIEFE